MSKQMLVNVTHTEESRVAILEDGVLAAYEIETSSRATVRGNIYNAVVEKVQPSLEAAFLHIGPDLKGFLPLDEVNFRLLPARGDRKGARISQHLHAGQKLIVQVVREPFSGKPATVSTFFSLPGRFLVLMPGVDSSGISRKIEDESQREKLKKLAGQLKVPEGFGVIVRTAGLGQTKTELQRDLRYLLRLWESIQKASTTTPFPGGVYREADLVIRTIRDYFTPDISEVWIDSPETFSRAEGFVRDVMPKRARTLQLYTGEKPIFNKFNLEEQIERIYKRRVPLPSGGEIVIDGTEAMTAIDVNSARSRRKGDLEELAVQTNIEAAVESARQLRLRDLGGLVVIDFIDMNKTSNKSRVERTLKEAFKGDKARHDMTRISKLGLVEIARQRLKGEKLAASYVTCTDCEGFGLVKTLEAAGLSAFRKLHSRCARGDIGRITLELPHDVANWLLNQKRQELIEVEQRHGLTIEVRGIERLLRHETRFSTEPRSADSPRPEIKAAPTPAPAPTPARSEAPSSEEVEEKPAPKTRRRRAPRRSEREREPERSDSQVSSSDAESSSPPVRKRRTRAPRRTKVDTASDMPRVESKDDAPEAKSTEANNTEISRDSDARNGEEKSETRPRRRRRRRRTPREERSDAPKEARPSAPAEAPQPNIRADELMPAAVGTADGQRGATRRRGSRGGSGGSGGGGRGRGGGGRRRG